MPPLDFPASPSTGQTYAGPGGAVWSWDGAKWVNGASASAVVSSFNTRTGAVTLSSGDVTTALTYTPYNATNPSGYQTAANVTTALVPYATLAAPVFTGDARAVTPTAGDNDTSVATTAFVQSTVAPAFNGVGRNLLHNPLFNVAQRGVGPWTGVGGAYTVDRWQVQSGLDATTTNQTIIVDGTRAAIGDESAEYALDINCTGNAGAGSYTIAYQPIERVRRLAGKTVVISFWAAASSGTPKLGISIDQSFGTGGSPSAVVQGSGVTVTLGTTWARYSTSIIVPGVSGKTLGTANNDATMLNLWVSAGSSFATRSGGVGVQTARVFLWGVQLEVGSVATLLEKPDPQQDLAKCQRFYQTGRILAGAYGTTGLTVYHGALLPVPMRATPIITATNGSTNIGSFVTGPSATTIYLQGTVTATGGYLLDANPFTASADL